MVKFRAEGWRDKPLDAGLNELLPADAPDKPKKLRPIVDSANLAIKRPWPLNGEGRKKMNPTDTPEELEFLPYKEIVFGTLKPFQEATWQTQ